MRLLYIKGSFQSVGCVKCDFSTASPFSTNLKMHLKAHHKDDYMLVLRLEAQQREEEGIRADNGYSFAIRYPELISFIFMPENGATGCVTHSMYC